MKMIPPVMSVLFLVELDPLFFHQLATLFRPLIPHSIIVLDIDVSIKFGVRPVHPCFLPRTGGEVP